MQHWQVSEDAGLAAGLEAAAAVLASGGVVAVPTDTFYGLAADIRCPAAIDRVARLKGGRDGKPILLLVSSVGMARVVAPDAPALLEELAAIFWPGPLTLVVPAGPGLPPAVTARNNTVAIRHPDHPMVCALIEALGAPITGTSANLAGAEPVCETSAIQLSTTATLDGTLDAGPTAGGPASTLLDISAEPARVLRVGAVGHERLRAALGNRLL